MKATGKGASKGAPSTGIEYTSINPHRVPKKIVQRVGEEIEALAVECGGRLKAKDLVEAARAKTSVLHKLIWKDDDPTAAYKHRLALARAIMTTVQIKVNETNTPAFIHLRSSPGYIPARAVFADVDATAQFVKLAKNEALSFYRKWQRVRTAAGLSLIFDAVERSLAAELGIVTEQRTGTD